MRVVLADDEALARARLERLLGDMQVEVVGVASGGREALRLVREFAPDVVLLDIRMPDLGGLEVAELLAGEATVVFVTAHAEHAVEAFGVAAVDYVLKPVEPERLALALERARSRTPRGPERLALKTAKGIVLLDAARISHAVLDGELVTIHCDGRAWISDWSLAALEARLPNSLVRVSRQALLNLDAVEVLEPIDTGGYLAHTRGGAVVAVSRQAARKLRRGFGA